MSDFAQSDSDAGLIELRYLIEHMVNTGFTGEISAHKTACISTSHKLSMTTKTFMTTVRPVHVQLQTLANSSLLLRQRSAKIFPTEHLVSSLPQGSGIM